MNRLNTAVGFKEAAFKSALEDSMDLFSNEQAFKTFSQSSDREFQNQLAQMDINFAMQMADKMATAQANQNIFSGLGTAISGAATYAASRPAASTGTTMSPGNQVTDTNSSLNTRGMA